MLSPFFEPRYSTVLDEKSNNLLKFFFRCAVLITTELQPQNGNFLLYCCIPVHYNKMQISCSQLYCIEFDVPRTNFSIKHL